MYVSLKLIKKKKESKIYVHLYRVKKIICKSKIVSLQQGIFLIFLSMRLKDIGQGRQVVSSNTIPAT